MTDTRTNLSPSHADWLTETFARNRSLYAGWRMEATGGDGGDGADEPKFTQADIDAAVTKAAAPIRADERKKVEAKFADYDDLKTRADGAKTLEDRLGELETKSTASELRALRAEIAAEFGISTRRGENDEPSDAELFLTGSDSASMRAQAERLGAQIAERESERKKKPPRSPRESTSTTSTKSDQRRQFLRELTGSGD